MTRAIKVNIAPIKRQAYYLTNKAIAKGELIRPSNCNSCGGECSPQAHHDNYFNPLAVLWLCRNCHAQRHRTIKTRYLNNVQLVA